MGVNAGGRMGEGRLDPQPLGDVSLGSCSVRSGLSAHRGSLGRGWCEPRGDGRGPAELRAGQPRTTRLGGASGVFRVGPGGTLAPGGDLTISGVGPPSSVRTGAWWSEARAGVIPAEIIRQLNHISLFSAAKRECKKAETLVCQQRSI